MTVKNTVVIITNAECNKNVIIEIKSNILKIKNDCEEKINEIQK